MVQGLQSFSLDYVNTLRDEVHWDESAEENSSDSDSWEKTPIFVVGEKFGRGLDIPNVKYVILAAPPTSPAAYAHLAGRTGRGGKEGISVTFVQGMKEAIRLVSLADALGVKYAFVASSINLDNYSTCENNGIGNEQLLDLELDKLSVAQLKDKLREKGLKVTGRKSELIERLRSKT